MIRQPLPRLILMGTLLLAAVRLAGCSAKAPASTAPATAQAGGHAHDHAEAEPHGHTQAAAPPVDPRATPAEPHSQAPAGGDACCPPGELEHTDEVHLQPGVAAQHGIRTAPAQPGGYTAQPLTVPGRIAYNAEAMAHVGTPVRGRAVELPVGTGAVVRRGDVLAVIDSPELGELQAAYLQRLREAEVARAELEPAQSAAERARRLFEGQGLSRGELERRAGEARSALARLRAAESAVQTAATALTLHGMRRAELRELAAQGGVVPRYTVRAPIEGQVVEREVTLGEVVGPEREALLVLANLQVLWALAEVPEQQLQAIALGTTATVRAASAGPAPTLGAEQQGLVTHIAPQLNPETRTAQVRIELPGTASPLRPGMFVEVSFLPATAAGAEAAVLVPADAVQNVEGSSAVFVPHPGEPDSYAVRRVELGPARNQQVPVLAGLRPGEPVVVAGAFLLKAELAKGVMEGKSCSGH